jgi:hypothetical protein
VTAAARPGWYPDPAGAAGLFRWWDGSQWADVTSDSVQAPPPIPVSTEFPAAGSGSRRQTSPLRIAAALGLGFALFVSASIGLGLIIWPGQTNTSPQRAAGGHGIPSAGSIGTDPVGYLDERTRTATIGPASLTMPADPYVLKPDPMTIRGVFDLFFWASAPVHARYDGKQDWSSGVLLAQIAQSNTHGQLETEGTRALHRLSSAIFAEHPTELKDLTWNQHSVDGRPGMLFTAHVYYNVDKLPSRYDTVTAVLVRLDDGALIMAASSVPNDTDDDVARQASDALKTLTVG